MDYNTLIADKNTAGSIANWINRSDLPTAPILEEAQAWIYQRMRVREMQVLNPSFTFAINTQSIALPADFLDPIQYFPWGWAYELPFAHEQKMLWNRDPTTGVFTTDTPSRWTVIGLTAYVDVLCQANFSGDFMYYGLPTPLSALNPTNWLTTRYVKLMREACIGIGYEHAKDSQRAQGYLQAAEASIQEAMRTNDMFRRGQLIPS